MNIINHILSRQEFVDHPPVLIDIGASGRLPAIWKPLSRYSICIAFDADDREMDYFRQEPDTYKNLYVYNRILTSNKDSKAEFYLTKSPYCSSLLRPLNERLADWALADLFQVERKVVLKTITLPTVTQQLGLDRVDWFKTDSQGTDLRLFTSLGGSLMEQVLVAQFEPGIIDAYEGEDKLWQLMAFMDQRGFWMSDMMIRGSQRVRADIMKGYNKLQVKLISQSLKKSPGWAEISYINSFKYDFGQREFLLGWVFSTLLEQHGFALEIAYLGHQKFNDPIFLILKKRSKLIMQFCCFKHPFSSSKALLNKIIGKIFRSSKVAG